MINIRRAIKSIAYDNGAVNRTQTIDELLGVVEPLVSNAFTPEVLASVDAFLADLSEEELETICNGEESEVELLAAPEGTDEVLNFIFDNLP